MITGVNTTDYTTLNTDPTYQAQGAQNRYRKGQGQGLGTLMTQLTPEQRQEISQLIQSVPEELRPEMKNELLQLEGSTDLYSQMVAVIQNYLPQTATTATDSSTVDVYA